ncbi:binding-protein-dependent transport systems inner membrane component [Petrotoga mobilis SJ95]|uniref:Binding-protein-dependent transport systems inner membrane component n=1 Tax=Petrotoga mobilis (strain DSM 10674 / SJ95) TaxID=403833 RepID=A9BGN2_PETMO|nr:MULTISPECIES: ABC transporter permease [Petrotoga]ABX32272.1 binding-protein-dependent transport systems inner membrane component [Petrotoga mobilis SJ95]PNR89018.1 peptide ABC transporter permease [Petrotoga sp. 9T1HF07.CasAA.8.2]RLL86120.1 peptide ABC transporter permease [Petrotoga sp. Shatin.DS.tank11.9.2.9.3]
MTTYIIRRLLLLPLIMLGVTLIVFSMQQLLGPLKLLSTYVDPNTYAKLSDQDKIVLMEQYGLTDPWPVRYGKWIGNLFKGDLGWSVVGKEPVLDALLHRFPYTVELALYAIFPIIGIGIWLGVTAAVHHNSFIDQAIRIFALIGWSLPDFVWAILVLLIFYIGLGWFPPGNLSLWADEVVKSATFNNYTNLLTIDALLNGRIDIFWDALRHILGPIIAISWLWWANLLRITRSSMLEVLRRDYIRTARSKGLPERVVINKHARRNALIPVVTTAGQMVIGLLAGVVIVEMVFVRTGLGSFAATAAQTLDYASIMGVLLFTSFILIVGNLIIDISYAFIDPRIRLG